MRAVQRQTEKHGRAPHPLCYGDRGQPWNRPGACPAFAGAARATPVGVCGLSGPQGPASAGEAGLGHSGLSWGRERWVPGQQVGAGRGFAKGWSCSRAPAAQGAGSGRPWQQLCLACAEGMVARGVRGRLGAPCEGSGAAAAGCWARGQAGTEPEPHGLCLGKAEPLRSPSCPAVPTQSLSCRSYRIWPPSTPTWLSSRSVGAPRWGPSPRFPWRVARALRTP